MRWRQILTTAITTGRLTVFSRSWGTRGSPDGSARSQLLESGRRQIGRSAGRLFEHRLENPLCEERIGSQGEGGAVLLDCPETARFTVLPGALLPFAPKAS